jgi:hypothetical protein
VSLELAQAARARLTANKAESAGRNPDPLATIWRGIIICGHSGQHLYTSNRSDGYGRLYTCHSRRAGPDGQPVLCPGGSVNANARVLDPAAWADVVAWLSDDANVTRLLADWDHERTRGADSLTSRLDALDATTATLRGKMANLAETIADTSDRESRAVLQATLDSYAAQVRTQGEKRAKLLQEAAQASEHAAQKVAVRQWVQLVATEAADFTPAEQVTILRALGAELTLWREDYMHPDGWPKRYKIVLHFTGFTGQPVVLPAHPDAHYL